MMEHYLQSFRCSPKYFSVLYLYYWAHKYADGHLVKERMVKNVLFTTVHILESTLKREKIFLNRKNQ